MGKKNIILIGFMGTGKTTIGKRMARVLGRDFFDTDEDIQYVTGMTIPQIFSRYDEIRFRSEEALAVLRAVSRDNRVIATGGGVILSSENLDILKANGQVVLLKTNPEAIFDRIGRKGNRPLLGKNITLQKITEILREREGFYDSAADLIIHTDNLESDEVVKKIITELNLAKEAHYENLDS